MHQYFYRSLEVHAVDRCRIRQIPAGSTVGWCWRGLSGGFRYHHEDPTAICRISWFEYASHIHLLAVVVLCLSCNCINCLLSCWELSVRLVRFELRLAPHSRGLRFFWVWGLATWQHFKLFCLGSTWQCHAVTCDNMRHGLDLVRFGAICSRQHIAGHTFRLKSSRGGKRLCRICWS